MLYFHGGGFVAGSCELYRDLAGRIAISSGVPVLTVEYRLAPEHLYPAANEDCLQAYRWLVADGGYLPGGIVLGGDSVGGSLALMTLLSLRDGGETLPAGAFLLSPHTDLVHLDGESYRSRAELDPTGSMESSRRILEAYVGGLDGSAEGTMPAILSPLRMDLRGLPRLFVQVADPRGAAERCNAACRPCQSGGRRRHARNMGANVERLSSYSRTCCLKRSGLSRASAAMWRRCWVVLFKAEMTSLQQFLQSCRLASARPSR